MRAKPLSRSLVYWCVAVFVLAVCCALVPGRAFAEVAGPFEVEGPTDSFEWDGSTLTITANGVTIQGMSSADAPAGAVVVGDQVQTVGIGANVRISTLTVKRATTFVVSGTNNEVFQVDTVRDDAIGDDGSITIETGDAGVDVFDRAVVRVDGPIQAAHVWQKARLVLGPRADVKGPITVYGGILDLSQVMFGAPIPIGGIAVGTTATLAIVAPFGATDLHQLITYQNLVIYDAVPVYENEEEIGTLNTDGSFNITATRQVAFRGFDGAPLATETIKLFGAATAPVVTVPEGYRFVGWDQPFDYVTKDMTVNALFEPIPSSDVQPTPPAGTGGSGGAGSAGCASVTKPSKVSSRATLAATGDAVPRNAMLVAGMVAAIAAGSAVVAAVALARVRHHS
ncbi:hypothetical protein [Gordonibacter sp.]|uniref:hypothetical protein n=1 Tax=Gordonibacter sp. TaxID=1968902 RepID=UPI0025C25AE6|nr:hypothetical protein [Gordonibacter sp.]